MKQQAYERKEFESKGQQGVLRLQGGEATRANVSVVRNAATEEVRLFASTNGGLTIGQTRQFIAELRDALQEARQLDGGTHPLLNPPAEEVAALETEGEEQ